MPFTPTGAFREIPPIARGTSPGFIRPLLALGFSVTRALVGIIFIFPAVQGLFSANNLSAKEPCFSLALESFLTAYSTRICLPEKYCRFICAIAKSAAWKQSQLTNPCPFDCPSYVALTTLVPTIIPKLLKVSYSIFSSTSGSRLPMNKLAPTSWFFLSCEALFTLIGLPYSFTMCMILIEQSASSSLLNSTKPNPWCSFEILSRGMCTLTTGPH